VADTRPALTTRQKRILEVIEGHVTEHGYPPSLRELGAAVGLGSSSSVAHQLTVLQARGYLRRDSNKPRALTVIPAGRPLGVPTELRRAALAHAIEQYAGPDDDTIPVLRQWLEELGGDPESDDSLKP